MDPQYQFAPVMLDFKVLAVVWTFVTAIFTAGAVFAAIRFGLRSVSEKADRLDRRVNTLELRRETDRDDHRDGRERDMKQLDGMVKSVEATIASRLDSQEAFMKSVLFRQDGTTNYLPRGECEQCRITCQTRLDNRLEAIQRTIDEADRRREESKDDITKMFNEMSQGLAKLSGSVEEHHQRQVGGP